MEANCGVIISALETEFKDPTKVTEVRITQKSPVFPHNAFIQIKPNKMMVTK